MKNLLLVICLSCFLLSGCFPAQLLLGAIDIVAKSSGSDPCKGKSTSWDPGSKKYYCYDENGDKVYK